MYSLYNVQYDYIRVQEWKNGFLICDDIELESIYSGYGHLQVENSCGEMGRNWKNPYLDDFELVKPEEADLFRKQGLLQRFYSLGLCVEVLPKFYVRKYLEKPRHKGLNLLMYMFPIDSEPVFPELYAESSACSFSPVVARMERLKQIQEHARYLRCEGYMPYAYGKRVLKNHPEILEFKVPLDPRFID